MIVVPSRRFRKTLRKYQAGGMVRIVENVNEVALLLTVYDDRAAYVLRTRWQEHVLKGRMCDIHELHLSRDDLLLFSVREDLGIIELLDIVKHEQLRKKGG